MGENDTYKLHVSLYLHSMAGRDTPPSIAARLAALGPRALAMSHPPTPEQLHNTRQCLEDLADMARVAAHSAVRSRKPARLAILSA